MASVRLKFKNKDGFGQINYRTSIDNISQGEFWFADLYSLIKDEDFVVIDGIFIDPENRNNGFGTEMLDAFCKTKAKEDKLIIAISGLLTREYPNEDECKRIYLDVLGRLDTFCKERGFVNTNEYTKSYEFKNVYVYTENERGKNFVNAVKRLYR